MAAIRVSNLEILKSGATVVLTAVECLKPGQKACAADSNGNIGAGNRGTNNFGTNNVGNDNIGNANVGNANWGNNNKGTGNRCFNKTGDRKIFGAVSSGKIPVAYVVTTGGYTPYSITCNLYSNVFFKLATTSDSSPTSAVSTITGDPQYETIVPKFVFGSATILSSAGNINEIVPLTVVNSPSPPPMSFPPPPPALGPITGSVKKSGNDFSFSIKFGSVVPNYIAIAFFTGDDALAEVGGRSYSGSTTNFTMQLAADKELLVSYAQVVGVTYGGDTTNALNLNW
ncbi:hypothetical protein APUTEX25_004960 [Auxenochlorella protothecoides]|uniref:Uncharacterized protein n=1 Tax=Auxenochlorella protothecoides TaxID=3075 RepID=A0A3M7KW38_AUXPR|nr:hypothetical protein APUTEX25_004960 [Auxenochlorella protothecoides]|eukprot:RMZ53935.1 hypothetical protein APUTEX25_004960 [Auxenochlorella protothecoides]